MPTNLPTLPPGTPGWIVLAIFITVGLKYLFQFLSEMSETAAKFFGPLGKRWRTRGLARQQERREETSVRIADLEADLDYYRSRSEDSDRRADAADGRSDRYLEWYRKVDMPFHRDLQVRAAESGCEMPPWESLSNWEKGTHTE